MSILYSVAQIIKLLSEIFVRSLIRWKLIVNYCANFTETQLFHNLEIKNNKNHPFDETFCFTLQNFDNEEDLLQTATTDITQLCAENVILWTQFIEVVSLDRNVLIQLAQEHHTGRVGGSVPYKNQLYSASSLQSLFSSCNS